MITKNYLESFIFKIDNFISLNKTEQAKYFLYFLTISNFEYITAKDILECYNLLKLEPYSNVPKLLKSFSEGKQKILLKKKIGEYVLIAKEKERLDKVFSVIITPPPSDELFPKSIFDKTRGYLVNISKQAINCYDLGLYDACAVMLRKLLEILIIECFERYKIDNKIKDKNGDFLYLKDLLKNLISETSWNIGRNQKSGFEKIKKFGDLSAHNRRYCANKNDIDNLKGDLRLCYQELVNLIDYKNWI
ncbi:MAG: hypothetical protein ACI4PF_06970 [Christensenellales bacterium]